MKQEYQVQIPKMSDNILPAFYPNYMTMVRAKSWSEIMVRCNLYFHSLIFWILSNFTNSYQVSNHYGTQVWQLLSHNIVFFYNEKSSGRSGEKEEKQKNLEIEAAKPNLLILRFLQIIERGMLS